MFNLDIYTTGAAHLVTVPASVSIPAAPVDIPVQVPHDQPTTNNYGLASTVVRRGNDTTRSSTVLFVSNRLLNWTKNLYFVEER